MRGKPSIVERVWVKLDREGPMSDLGTRCWTWKAATDGKGYGVISVGRRMVKAHKVLYEIVVGPVPEGLELDHLCRRPLCVNPSHLEPVTHRENCIRGAGAIATQRAKTHCPKGHPYDETNTYVTPSRPGARYCRACARENAKRQNRRRAQLQTEGRL